MRVSRFIIAISTFLALFFLIPVSGEILADDSSDWTIYFRPAIRCGTDSRALYILDFLVPIYQSEESILFLNPKFTPDNQDGWETNIGLGYRHLLSDDDFILGANIFYDHRKTKWGSHFNQLGVGLEAMADINDIGLTGRVNYYCPLSDEVWGTSNAYAFYGNGLYTAGLEEPMMGFDYEAGLRIPYVSDYVETWAYAGGYHFFSDHASDVNGLMARLEVIPTNLVKLNLEFRHDDINESEFYTELGFEVPFSVENLVAGENPFEGIGDMMHGSRALKERMVEPVRRDVDIFTQAVPQNIDEKPENAVHGKLLAEVVFVSEGAETISGTRDGTFGHPYASITEAVADPRISGSNPTCTTIHVMNDNKGDLVVGGGTVDKGDLLVWGPGSNYSRKIINMTHGYPTFNETIVLDAPNIEVMGLGFDMGLGFTGNSAIDIQNGTGIVIKNNLIDWFTADPLVYGIHADIGTDIGSPAQPLLLTNNKFTITYNDLVEGDAYGIYLRSSGGDIFVRISTSEKMSKDIGPSSIDGYGPPHGIYLEASNGNIGSEGSPVVIEGNPISLISPNIQHGIELYAANDIFASITKNEMTNYFGGQYYGIYLHSDGGNIGSEQTPLIVSNNQFDISDDTRYVVGIWAEADKDIFASITGNDMPNGFDGTGIWLQSYDGSVGSRTLPVIISGNNITIDSDFNDEAYGIRVYAEDDIFSTITNNYLYINNDYGGGDAYGCYLNAGNLIGDATSVPTFFTKNSGKINGENDSYLLYLFSGHIAGNNWVIWHSINFTPPWNGWSGNYPTSPGPVWHNFDIVGGDVLSP